MTENISKKQIEARNSLPEELKPKKHNTPPMTKKSYTTSKNFLVR